MVWGDILIDGKCLYVFNSESVIWERYRDVLLEAFVRLFIGAYVPVIYVVCLFLDVNACPHQANLVDEWLESQALKRILLREKPSDLKPAELTYYSTERTYYSTLEKQFLEDIPFLLM